MTLWPLTVEILITFTLSACLLYRYGNWLNQNVITTLSVFVAWFFSFIVIFILPLDISNTAYRQCVHDANMSYPIDLVETDLFPTDSPNSSLITTAIPIDNSTANGTTMAPVTVITIGPSLNIDSICHEPWSYTPGEVLPTLWKVVYWTSQVLTWIVLPMMQSYSMAGDFTTWGKLKSAFYENAIYYGSFAVIFVILLIYVMIHSELDMANLKIICITASNTWGLFLLVVLLGYGLVEIPRSCYYTSQHGRTLSYLYFKVAKLSAEKCEAEEKLDDTLEEIHHAYESIITTHGPLKSHIENVLDKCPLEWRKQILTRYQDVNFDRSRGYRNTGISYNEKSLVRLHQSIIKAVQTRHRTFCQWDHLIKQAIEWEDVTRNESNPSRMYKSSLNTPSDGTFLTGIKNILYTPTVEWHWKCLIRSTFYKVLSYILIVFSVVVIWSEFTFSVQDPTLSIFALMMKAARRNYKYLFIELLSTLSIAYLCICAYYTVFKIRIFNYYYLASHHQTDEYSLIFCGMLLCRLTPPLCLNFLGLIHLDSHVTKDIGILETSFTQIMGHMDVLKKLSDGFTIYLPIVMVIFCLATFFQFGSRLLHLMGMEQFMIDDDMTTELIREGQDLVKREKTKRLRQVESDINRGKWSAITSRATQVTVPVESPPNVPSGHLEFHTIHRTPSDESARIELLNDVEPMDYATTWNSDITTGRNYNSFDSQPQKGIFDDI